MTTSWTRPPGTAPALAVSPLAGALNREWQRLCVRRQPPPATWRADARLARFASVDEALVEMEDRASAPAQVEEVLAALAERAAEGDEAAIRVVVQYLMPCLVRVAYTRRRMAHPTARDAIDELVTVAWETAREGVETRGRRMKIALLRTIEHRALRQPARVNARRHRREVLVGSMGEVGAHQNGPVERTCPEELVAGLSGRAITAPVNAGEDVVRLLADATTCGLSPADVQLVGSLAVGWSTTEQLGAAEGVSDRSVRYRRAAAERRLADRAA